MIIFNHRELVNATTAIGNQNGEVATTNPQATPLLHHMSAAHAYIQMFVTVNRTGLNDIRNILVSNGGSDLGLNVLKGLSKLYTSLVWESNILLALCSEDALPAGCEFGKADLDKLLPSGAGSANQSSANTPAGGSATLNAGAGAGPGQSTDEQQTFSPR